MATRSCERLAQGQDVVLHAPTGAGKTLIFELWCDQGKNRKQQAIYTVPTRALANDKLAEWRAKGGMWASLREIFPKIWMRP